MSSKLKFIDSQRSEFFATTRRRVDSYFQNQRLSKHATPAMWAKITFFLLGAVVLYGLLLSNQFSAWANLGVAALLGAFCAFIGFNVCHDAMHGALSENPRVNKLMSLTFNLIGANAYVWSITHNQVHHTFTNIPGHDEDIEVAPGLIRISHEEKVNSIQRYQHWYAFLLYGLASLSWVMRKDYVKFFQPRIGQHDNLNHPRVEYFNLFFFKAVYYTLFIVVPLLVMDVTWWQFLIGFTVMHLTQGFVLGLVFQLAHVVEGTDFPVPNGQGNIEEAWAVHQMRTTANFATNSRLATFLCGGLNRQIEHHLFPRICHVHYPAISRIVKETAQEFGVLYLENATFGAALQSHYRMLRKFGQEAYHERKSREAYNRTLVRQQATA